MLSRSLRVGGYEMDEAITRYLRVEHSLAIGSQTAEAIKIAIGSAVALRPEEVDRGSRPSSDHRPADARSSSAARRCAAAIDGPLGEIVEAIKDTLEQTPPELTGDIARDGILLAGGGTLLRGFPELVAAEDGHAGRPRRRRR